ncbi:hypothetical protein V1264_023171 [Littorina saxatilis]
MDVEGGCIKKTEDQSTATLKHKQDVRDADGKDGNEAEKGRETSSPTGQNEPEESNEDWSQSLQKFCFCEKGAVSKKGRPRWRSMCRYHRLRMKKDINSKCSQGSSNLVQASHTQKPVLRESKLKQVERPGAQFTMRAARFNFKPSVQSEIRFNFVKPGEIAFGSKHDDHTEVLAAGTAFTKENKHVLAPKTSLTAVGSATPKDTTPAKPNESANTRTIAASSHSVFAAEASKRLLSFSSITPKPGRSGASSSCKPAPKFEGHRVDRSDRRHHLALWSQNRASRPSHLSSSHSRTTVATPLTAVPSRIDLSMERSCSQEARLDESEFNVNELAAYFDNFLYMPKEMSSMAQMMYT